MRLWAVWHTAEERLWARPLDNMIPTAVYRSEAAALDFIAASACPERYQPVRVDGAEVDASVRASLDLGRGVL